MALKEYECPACGGIMEFSAAEQLLHCPFCDTKVRVEDYKNPHDTGGGSAPAAEESSSSGSWRPGETDGMRIYSCGSCGGEIISSEVTGSMSCPFCGNNVVAGEQFSGDIRPDYVIPFKKSKDDAIKAYRDFLGHRRLLPKVFSDENHIDKIRGIYIPYWLYDVTVKASYTFEGTQVKTWSDRDYNYTDTSFYNIIRAGEDTFERIPNDASKEMPDVLMESIEPFSFDDAVPFNAGYLAGYDANRYDVTAEEVKPRIMERVHSSVENDIRATVQGYATLSVTGKNVNEKSVSNKYALYPVWLLSTTWKDKHFMFAMNGQTGKFVGDLPVSKSRAVSYYATFGAVFSVAMIIISFILTRL